MRKILLHIKDINYLSPLQQPHNYFPNQTPQISSPINHEESSSSGFNLNNMVSPTILLIIIILSIVFFISGLLHLLVRFLFRPRNRFPDELESVTALQGQLQQLFNLHDSGVDQSFIDALPVFNYKSIIGLKDPFDCAVCLSEFEVEDKLRLLPKCSHAFHMDCIDTWLLSHSTCPLCRDSLVIDFPNSRNCSPLVFVLESRSNEISREIVQESDCNHSGRSYDEVGSRVNSQLSNDQFAGFLEKSCEIEQMEDETQQPPPPPPREDVVAPVEKVVVVKLGKYRNVDSGGEGSSSSNSIDSRRCFSMGSFAYVMNENASLQVSIKPVLKKQTIKNHNNLPLHREALSDCGSDSRRELNVFDASRVLEKSSAQRESLSVSKAWLRGKIEMPNSAKVESQRRAFSFRFSRQHAPMPLKRLPPNKHIRGWSDSMSPYSCDMRETVSEIGFDKWEINNGFSELGCDDRCNNLDSQEAHAPSFARRTLLWLMGRPNKVVHSDSSSNV